MNIAGTAVNKDKAAGEKEFAFILNKIQILVPFGLFIIRFVRAVQW